jgi:hypothetical protein
MQMSSLDVFQMPENEALQRKDSIPPRAIVIGLRVGLAFRLQR